MQNASNVSAHRQLAQNPEFQRSLDVALLQYTYRLSKTQGLQPGITSLKIAGAVEFIDELKLLVETVKLPDVKPQDNLSQNK